MSVINQTAPLTAAADYAAMRGEGFAAIERLAHERWTDYNAHDPGITLLEHLLDALAEIGYRGSFDIADLLTTTGGAIDYRQPFFTARNILTNAPLTDNDYRRLLIDSQLLANAWMIRKRDCDCGPQLYPDCGQGGLRFAPGWRLLAEGELDEHEAPFSPKGFNDVFLQFAPDDEVGNLNSDRMDTNFGYKPLANSLPLNFELEFRFPEWRHWSPTQYDALVASEATLTGGTITNFRVHPFTPGDVNEEEFFRHSTKPFFCDLELTFDTDDNTFTLQLEGVSLIVRGKGEDKKVVVPANLIAQLSAANQLFEPYFKKLKKRHIALDGVEDLLHDNRNAGEDYCRYDYLRAEDVGVCADIKLAPEADLELTLAHFYHTVERHLSPSVPFRTLAEMEAAGLGTEDIFNGPQLTHGFILDEDLAKAGQRPVIYLSDVLNELMEIEGILSIERLRFTVYDAWGRQTETYKDDCLPVSPEHYPALYLAASGVNGSKEGLPLTPRQEELRSILVQLRADERAQALPTEQRDYDVPVGTHRAAGPYLPVQRTLPETYGLSIAGPPAGADDERLARIRQLSGYLMPFELITAHTEQQLISIADLFSTDEGISTTMPLPDLFGTGKPLAHLDNPLEAGIGQAELAGLFESPEEFQDRRNRFLDHLLARFGESLTNYPLLIHDQDERLAFTSEKLLADKIRFLRFYPEISAPRGLGINYQTENPACTYNNRSGLGERLRRLLGMADVRAFFQLVTEETEDGWLTSYSLRTEVDTTAVPRPVIAPAAAPLKTSPTDAEAGAWEQIRRLVAAVGNGSAVYQNTGGLRLVKVGDETLASLEPYSPDATAPTLAKAETAFRELVENTLQEERLFVVEHLLLRPKFPGDALMSVCLAEDCDHKNLQDPYSFRLTYVMPAEVKPFSIDIDLRRYAEGLIRRETPAHLLPKICWIDDRKREDELTDKDREELKKACQCPPSDELARQLSRFETAWCEWLEANAEVPSWTDEIAEMESLLLGLLPAGISLVDLRLFLGYFGDRYREEIRLQAELNNVGLVDDDVWFLSSWDVFVDDLDRIKDRDFALYQRWGSPDSPAARDALRDLLIPFYRRWQRVSYRLHRLLLIFENLHSVYPQATLHDCDDGDDDNPVRLGQTSLGTL